MGEALERSRRKTRRRPRTAADSPGLAALQTLAECYSYAAIQREAAAGKSVP
jgi:hypothetical protein